MLPCCRFAVLRHWFTSLAPRFFLQLCFSGGGWYAFPPRDGQRLSAKLAATDTKFFPRPRQVLRHRQGLENIARQKELYTSKSAKRPLAAMRSNRGADDNAQTVVLEQLTLDAPKEQLQVSCQEPHKPAEKAFLELASLGRQNALTNP